MSHYSMNGTSGANESPAEYQFPHRGNGRIVATTLSGLDIRRTDSGTEIRVPQELLRTVRLSGSGVASVTHGIGFGVINVPWRADVSLQTDGTILISETQ